MAPHQTDYNLHQLEGEPCCNRNRERQHSALMTGSRFQGRFHNAAQRIELTGIVYIARARSRTASR
ncbi:MAG: hypothetical protein FJY67_01435 [Calditrichaeota bacterium]|nr:hypothetical protein [Calditrichota bacterium]